MTQTPEDYANAFPERLMATAAQHAVVHMDIRREYAPILAADLYRGAVIVGRFEGPFEGSLGHALVQKAQRDPIISLTMPAAMARTMAIHIKAGGLARQGLH